MNNPDHNSPQSFILEGTPPVEVINPFDAERLDQKACPLILVCDHASPFVPDILDNLGLKPEQIQRHIGWDIGAAALTRALAKILGATCILAPVSRLVIDCNRSLDHAGLVPTHSDDMAIPGNQGLSNMAIQARLHSVYYPFHQAVEAQVNAYLVSGRIPMVMGVHSFTPVMHGKRRPWHIGFLWNKDPRLAHAIMGYLERDYDMQVGDNEPYSGRQLYYTTQRHGADHGLPQTVLEIRQDMLDDAHKVRHWVPVLDEILRDCAARSDIMCVRHYD